MILKTLSNSLEPLGLILFGAFHPDENDGVPEQAATVALVGNAGSSIWQHIAAYDDGEPHPMDRWTRSVLAPIADELGARSLFPFDKPPIPIQRWTRRAAPVHASPLGLLIHPDFGLWHAYRAAFLFDRKLELLETDQRSSPCETCVEKPCLSACPVGAFDGQGYDVPACAGHLAASREPLCPEIGCRARAACPVAPEYIYKADHLQFHMAAFTRSVLGTT